MDESACKAVDPRILRTRQALQQALVDLLTTRKFEDISVQDITDAATLNRATFYDHYADKFALLDSMVRIRFHHLLKARGVTFNSSCSAAVKAIALGVCDFLVGSLPNGHEQHRQMELHIEYGQLELHIESAVISVVRRMLLEGLKQESTTTPISPEMIATTASWAIYGAAKEWAQTPDRLPSEQIVDTIVTLVFPILGPWDPAPAPEPVKILSSPDGPTARGAVTS